MTEKKEKSNEKKEFDKKEKINKENECDKKIEELMNSLQHLQAEFENYKKREENMKEQFKNYCFGSVIEQMLPVLDSMNKALEQNNNEEKKGIELIQKQFIDVLKRNGLKEMDCVGKEFDPMMHEAISFQKNEEKKENVILEEVIKGYFFKEKILRHAKVIVNKKEKK